jgi:hypothetical protein
MGRACSKHGGDEKCIQNLFWKAWQLVWFVVKLYIFSELDYIMQMKG